MKMRVSIRQGCAQSSTGFTAAVLEVRCRDEDLGSCKSHLTTAQCLDEAVYLIIYLINLVYR